MKKMAKAIALSLPLFLISMNLMSLGAASPSTNPTSMQTFQVGPNGGVFSAYGVTVYIPAGLEVEVQSSGGTLIVPVTTFSILQWATGQTGPGPKNFPPGTVGVKAFGFMVNGQYYFNPGSNSPVFFFLDGKVYRLMISIETNGNNFWIWNPITGAFINVTAKTDYTVSNGIATASVVSPIFAWVITTPVSQQASQS